MVIYIATDEYDKGVRHVTPFSDREDLLSYARKVLAVKGGSYMLNGRSTIDDICNALYDSGPGSGSRSHCRISAKEAKNSEEEL